MKIILAILALSMVLFGAGLFAGEHTTHNLKVLDTNGNTVELDVPGDPQLYVAAPDGIQPGVLIGIAEDGSGILVVPPSLVHDYLDGESDPKEAPKDAPKAQNQSAPDEKGLPSVLPAGAPHQPLKPVEMYPKLVLASK